MPTLDPGRDARLLYDTILQLALRHALRRVDRARALEIAHDVASELVRRRLAGRDDPGAGSLDGLIFRAVSNRLHNLQRSANRRAAAERVHHDEQASTAPAWSLADGSLDLEELSRIVHASIARMPDGMRRVFLLIRRDNLSYREVAARLGVGVGTVHTQLARANGRLREAVARYHGASARQPGPSSPTESVR